MIDFLFFLFKCFAGAVAAGLGLFCVYAVLNIVHDYIYWR